MASLMIGRRKPKEDSAKRDKSTERTTKCPIFTMQYLGKLPSRGEYGREYISEPVECLLKLREKQRLPKTTLTFSARGFHFLDHDGPFGKEKHVLIPLHNICYGVADEQSPRVFALITRTDSNPESSLFECHGFLCDKRKTSNDITYWLLRTFLQVFEDLQKKKLLRQERRQQRQQQSAGAPVAWGPHRPEVPRHRDGRTHGAKAMSVSSIDRPFGGKSFSLILEDNKERGTAVRVVLTEQKDKPQPQPTRHSHARSEKHRALTAPDQNGNLEHLPSQGELISFTADVHPACPPQAQAKGSHPKLPRHPHGHGTRSTYVYSGESIGRPTRSTVEPARLVYDDKTVRNPRISRSSNGRYNKNVTHSSNSSGSRGTESILNRSTVKDESEFLFIDLLQEEFTQVGGEGRSTVSVRSGRMGNAVGPPNQTLRSEDIERRICEWLSAREDNYDEEMSVFGSDVSSPSPRMKFRRQWSSSDTVSVNSGNAYF